MNVNFVAAEERVLEGNIYRSIGVFYIEDHSVAAGFTPALDDFDAVVASCHQAGQVDGADFKVFGNGDGLLGYRCVEHPWNGELLASLQECAFKIAVRTADGFRQLAGGQV